jgi:2-dehydropantoate 2-reductase
LGTVFGVALQRAEHDVVFLGRSGNESRASVATDVGYVISRDGTAEQVGIDVTRDPSFVADADLVIVLVKTPDTVEAMERVAPFLSPDTPVVTLQNGLRAAERIRAVLGRDQCVIPGHTSQAATRTENHEVVHTGTGLTQIGFGDDRDRLAAEWISAIFTEAGIPTSVVDSIEHEIWQKVAVNAAINGVTALCGVANGAVVDNPALRGVALEVANETMIVAATKGFNLSSVEEAVIATATATAENRSSMLQDIDAGRPTEADAIYGEIQRAAQETGVATPRIDALLALIDARSREAETKERSREQRA